ncbi:unnamed protein product [Brassica napus]|uniref:(rape) hypothetical protein n=1 Tax=Brassica napus TaxID=3708 RepID=A0A816LNG8_BRANA|nr:unnamed protein product [Brassica napus]
MFLIHKKKMKLVDGGRIRWTTSTAWSKQTYYTPDGPQYSQQMIVGQTRPVLFMSPSPYLRLQDIIPYIFVKVLLTRIRFSDEGNREFRKEEEQESHSLCERCGRRSFHIQKSRRSTCAYSQENLQLECEDNP